MKPIVWLSLFFAIAASGCASGGSAVRTTESSSATTQLPGSRLIPFSLPLVTDSAIDASLRSSRGTQNSVGNIPTIYVPITVGLVDAPLFNLAQVNLAVERINAISNGNTPQQTETALQVYPGEAVVNVLNYQQAAANLGISLIPEGSYDALEFVCDPANSSVVTTSGQKIPMTFGVFTNGKFVPSPTGHGSLVLPYDFNATLGLNNVLIDLNVENSLNISSSVAEFAPSFFAVNGNTAAAIGGTVVDKNGSPVQNATAVVTDGNGNLLGLAPTDQSGNFVVHAINAGTYTLKVYEKYVTAAEMTVTASDGQTGTLGPWQVSVPAGFEAYIGTIRD
jgi:hypothetical protein